MRRNTGKNHFARKTSRQAAIVQQFLQRHAWNGSHIGWHVADPHEPAVGVARGDGDTRYLEIIHDSTQDAVGYIRRYLESQARAMGSAARQASAEPACLRETAQWLLQRYELQCEGCGMRLSLLAPERSGRVAIEPLVLRQVAEHLVDLDEGVQEWRYRHVKMVERTIGDKAGTGGSAGAAYLRSTLFRPVFPALWAVRSRL